MKMITQWRLMVAFVMLFNTALISPSCAEGLTFSDLVEKIQEYSPPMDNQTGSFYERHTKPGVKLDFGPIPTPIVEEVTGECTFSFESKVTNGVGLIKMTINGATWFYPQQSIGDQLVGVTVVEESGEKITLRVPNNTHPKHPNHRGGDLPPSRPSQMARFSEVTLSKRKVTILDDTRVDERHFETLSQCEL